MDLDGLDMLASVSLASEGLEVSKDVVDSAGVVSTVSTPVSIVEDVVFVSGREYMVTAASYLPRSAVFTPQASDADQPVPIMTESTHVFIPGVSAPAVDSSVGTSKGHLEEKLGDMYVDLDSFSA